MPSRQPAGRRRYTRIVILSGVAASLCEAATKSKDPYSYSADVE
jgi:hypothetical protein